MAVLVAAILCQAVLGYMGFHVSVSPPTTDTGKKYWKAAFIAVAALGVLLVAWSSISSDKVLRRILESLGPNALNHSAHLQIYRAEPFAPDSTKGLFVDVYYKNSGQSAVRGMQHGGEIYFAPHRLSVSEIDKVFGAVLNEIPYPNPLSTAEMGVGEEPQFYSVAPAFSGPRAITKNQIDALYKRGGQIYLLTAIRWIDTATKRNFVTEYCVSYPPADSAPEMCAAHNRVYRDRNARSP